MVGGAIGDRGVIAVSLVVQESSIARENVTHPCKLIISHHKSRKFFNPKIITVYLMYF